MRTKKIVSLILVLALLLSILPLQPLTTSAIECPTAQPAIIENCGAPYAEGRIVVQMADCIIAPFSAFSEPALPDFGIAISEMRLINPTCEGVIMAFSDDGCGDDTQNDVFVLTLDESIAVWDAVEILNAHPAVAIAEPDFIYEPFLTPNDPYFTSQWALQAINAPQAWNLTTGSRSVVVGVIDTGISGTHPDLAANLWVNPNPNQNGYINDIHGFNFADGRGGVPYDLHPSTHGTHVSGIIGAAGNNGAGTSGINWNVSLAWLGISQNGGSLLLSAAIEALNYANNNGIRVTNNSWGGYANSELLRQAIANYNGLFVAAAGNETNNNNTNPAFPASYNLPNIISVASTDEGDVLSYFSNYGSTTVHIAAPGGNILSTYGPNTYAYMSGTSMASPQVAGVAALLLSHNPNYTTDQMRVAILDSADRIPSLSGRVVTGGRLNAYNALTRAPVATISFAEDALTLDINDMAALTVQKYPPGAQTALVWESSNPSIVRIAPDGTLLALQSGTVTVTARVYVDPSISASATVTVTNTVSDVIPFHDFNFKQGVVDALNSMPLNRYSPYTLATGLHPADVQGITGLSLNSRYIANLSGLQFFTGLQTLSLSNNQITCIDMSNSPQLTSLDVSSNQMTKITVNNNAALTFLDASSNQLADIDVSGNPALATLRVGANVLTSIDVTGNTELTLLNVYSNQLTEIDVSNNTALTALAVSYNQLTSLDVSNSPGLTTLYAEYNQLTTLIVNMTTAAHMSVGANPLTNVSFQSDGQATNLSARGSGYVGLYFDRASASFYAAATPCNQAASSAFFCWTADGVQVGGSPTLDLNIGQAYDLVAHFGPFPDVPAAAWGWAQLFILEANDKGLMRGNTDGTFNPGGPFTRAEAAQVLFNMAGDPPQWPTFAPFPDVPASAWYAPAVAWAAENGIVQGHANGTFAPNDGITRQEFFVLMRNFATWMGIDTTNPTPGPTWPYLDNAQIAPWAVDAAMWTTSVGLIQGSGGRLTPTNTCTRAEAATIMVRFTNLFPMT
ncbi:MAG: S8 family serine peptidase [Oscillospiraceae bacterium]|nr:S8 family serine peptidase [Oscillospiraceae bacterium]